MIKYPFISAWIFKLIYSNERGIEYFFPRHIIRDEIRCLAYEATTIIILFNIQTTLGLVVGSDLRNLWTDWDIRYSDLFCVAVYFNAHVRESLIGFRWRRNYETGFDHGRNHAWICYVYPSLDSLLHFFTFQICLINLLIYLFS